MDFDTAHIPHKELLYPSQWGGGGYLARKRSLIFALQNHLAVHALRLMLFFSMPGSARIKAMVHPLPRINGIVYVAPCLLRFDFKPMPSAYIYSEFRG